MPTGDDYGAYKLTSRFREDAVGWQINNGKEWKTPQEVIDAVEKEYVNQFDTIAIRQQLLRLKQKRTETLAEYTRNFEELSGRINDYSDEQLVTMYTDGMLPKHREAIIMALSDSMAKAKTIAHQRDRLQGAWGISPHGSDKGGDDMDIDQVEEEEQAGKESLT